jgi:hypothetical protein
VQFEWQVDFAKLLERLYNNEAVSLKVGGILNWIPPEMQHLIGLQWHPSRLKQRKQIKII